MGTQGTNDLLSTWITGWATCRGYDRQDDGRTTSVVLTDKGGRDEHFLYEPSEELLLQVAAETKADPNRVLTVATNRMEDLLAVTRPLALQVVDRQSLMSADMADQDVEDPRPPTVSCWSATTSRAAAASRSPSGASQPPAAPSPSSATSRCTTGLRRSRNSAAAAWQASSCAP
ncbi:hypothetical protein [Arthrobacter sp. MSA 4-2]|uniref:hypothetical protein n=1 Tax=Arthrobacter sp. MSA 4-2 TaxID=2794349 RepID=UPI001E3DC5A9|nr:hypothetical protein [Arthrobacter sp. MSA 4-2]